MAIGKPANNAKRVWECCWEMLLMAIGKPANNAKRVWECCWEMPNGYWIASGQVLKSIGKPCGSAQIKLIPAR